MDEALFGELLASVGEALDHAKGKRVLRTATLPPAPAPMTAAEVRRLRRQLNASQSVFAHYLSVSAKLVQAWESSRRKPEGPALKLLRLAEANPNILLGGMVAPKRQTPKASRVKRRAKVVR